MAISLLKRLQWSSDFVNRYFTFNIYYYGYNNLVNVKNIALFGLSDDISAQIFTD